ncbi:AraC family transcriptional regulator [Faecalicatena contorta]|uniref:AraC family transcriptional regulator n=1 Tax=Faecalicatena contorta TaxID=39482 RepID=UPI0031D8C763
MSQFTIPSLNTQTEEHILFPNEQFHYSLFSPVSEIQFLGDVPWHWHTEFEFGYVLEGEILYQTNRHEFILRKGDGIFINSGIPHFLHVITPYKDSKLQTQFFDSSFLVGNAESFLDTKYVFPVMEQKQLDCIPFFYEKKEDRPTLNLIAEAACIGLGKKLFFELRLRNIFTNIWETIYTHAANQTLSQTPHRAQEDERIKQLLLFIQKHYAEKLTVRRISDCIPISERECYRIFQSNLGISPMEFLLSIRLKKAVELLINTQKSIVEIALETGFGNSSYFGKHFKQSYHISPGEYRRQYLHDT